MMDMQLVVPWNVPRTCLDQIDADRGITIINSLLASLKLITSWSYQMYFSNSSFYDRRYPFLSPTHCLTHTLSLSLCLSAILLSSPLFPFYIKCCPTIWWVSINKRIPLSTVLISKVTSIRNNVSCLLGKSFTPIQLTSPEWWLITATNISWLSH